MISIDIPSSKSLSIRAYFLKFLAVNSDEIEIKNGLDCEDTRILQKALSQWKDFIKDSDKQETTLDCGLSGAVSRFLLALSLLTEKTIIINGRGQLCSRPQDEIIEILRLYGKKIEFLSEDKKVFPLRVSGKIKNYPQEFFCDSKRSGQFLSALLMICPLLKGPALLKIKTNPLHERKSVSYVELNIHLMKIFGVEVLANEADHSYLIQTGQFYKGPGSYEVEGDWSSASYFLLGKEIIDRERDKSYHLPLDLRGLRNDSFQGDKIFPVLLQDVKNAQRFEFLMKDCPDLVPSLALGISLFGQVGKAYHIQGVEHLRFKESDRLQALANGLMQIQSQIEVKEGEFIITPSGKEWTFLRERSSPLVFDSYDDHRMVMIFSLLKLINPFYVQVNDEIAVDKSYPAFHQHFRILRGQISIFALTGPRGVGKTTFGRQLAQRLGLNFLDLDEEITKKTGKTIEEITDKGKDWLPFRQLEMSILEDCFKDLSNVVVALGGGTGVHEFDDLAKKQSEILKSKAATLIIHLNPLNDFNSKGLNISEANCEMRPPLPAKASEKSRLEKYLNLADISFDLQDYSSFNEIEANILAILEGRLYVNFVLGSPIAHSLSPSWHMAYYKEKNIPFFYFSKKNVNGLELRKVLDRFSRLFFKTINGLALTSPLKGEFQNSKVVNSLLREKNEWLSQNTDIDGLYEVFCQNQIKNFAHIKSILLLGSGGAAEAALIALRKYQQQYSLNWEIIQLSRSLGEEEFAKRHVYAREKCQFILQATPVGMQGTPYEDQSLLSDEDFSSHHIVLEMIYAPQITPFLVRAMKKGAKVIKGQEMFEAQAKAQAQFFLRQGGN